MKKKSMLSISIAFCCLFLHNSTIKPASHLRTLLNPIVGFYLVKNLVKPAAIAAAGYFLLKSIMNFKVQRTKTRPWVVENPDTVKISIDTDARVIIRPSTDNTISVEHQYGASDRTDLNGIHTGETFNTQTNTLIIDGYTSRPPQSAWRTLLTKIFKLTPQRTLIHIINAPRTCPLEIKTRFSPSYTDQADNLAIDIDGMVNDIDINSIGTERDADIKITHAGLDEVLEKTKLEDSDEVRDITGHNTSQPKKYGNIHIRTYGGRVTAHDFKGELIIDRIQRKKIHRNVRKKNQRNNIAPHPQNPILKFVHNGQAEVIRPNRPQKIDPDNIDISPEARAFAQLIRDSYIQQGLRSHQAKPEIINTIKQNHERAQLRQGFLLPTDLAFKNRARQERWYSQQPVHGNHRREGPIELGDII